jgi:hypothetical protein
MASSSYATYSNGGALSDIAPAVAVDMAEILKFVQV